MNKNLYGLMNWPEIEGIVYAECDKPKELLGAHVTGKGLLIQIMRPDAVAVKLHIEGRKTAINMEKVDEAGFFAALVSSKKKLSYTYSVEKVNGEVIEYSDPYAFENVTKADSYKAFLAGEEMNAAGIFGAHETIVNGVSGVLFTVWAPKALSVSVVGEFNKYDGRVHIMQRIDDTGVFELFIPGLEAGCEYMYEIKKQGRGTVRKLDPVSRTINTIPVTASVVSDEKALGSYVWNDSAWMLKRKREAAKKTPVTVYEVSLDNWSKAEKKEYIVDYVKEQGYTHVCLLPVSEYLNEDMDGYSTIGYFAPSHRAGGCDGFKKLVDNFHNAGVGVIMDWNGAYFGTESKGLYDFDGADAYGYLKPSLEKHHDWDVVTFDYKKGAVRSFLMSSVLMWLNDYHIDGIRIDGVASMLYLDYGKQPGTWTPNIYGGNENLDAIEFIKTMNKCIAKRKDGCFTIAEESSGWFGVTAADNDDSLMFTYKQNNCWTKDFLEFMGTDPLFRKGEYDKLTYGMLYNYGEDFILSLNHDDFREKAFVDMVSGSDEKTHLSDIKAALGFMYAHPGCKMFTAGQDAGIEKFMAELNKFYVKNAAMYELDNDPEGFMWLENSNPDETVIAMQRMDSKGNKLVVAVNFTPVKREGYRLHVDVRGKYKEVLNSEWKKFGGDEKVNGQIIRSDNDGDDMEYIDVTLPGLSVVIYNCEPYTQLELEEIAVLKRAAVAKQEAMKKAAEAERLELAAAEEAKRAVEARQQAEKACREALEAKEEAVRKAEEAARASEEIDIETKKQLEQLKKKMK